MRFFGAVLAMALLSATASKQTTNKPVDKNGESMVSTDRCLPKGGLGIIYTHLYIDLKSPNNELLLDEGRWVGKSRQTREVVFFFANKVWSSAATPPDFDLGKAQLVSFEGDVVRFFNFANTSGGYYERSK